DGAAFIGAGDGDVAQGRGDVADGGDDGCVVAAAIVILDGDIDVVIITAGARRVVIDVHMIDAEAGRARRQVDHLDAVAPVDGERDGVRRARLGDALPVCDGAAFIGVGHGDIAERGRDVGD